VDLEGFLGEQTGARRHDLDQLLVDGVLVLLDGAVYPVEPPREVGAGGAGRRVSPHKVTDMRDDGGDKRQRL
ncbi:hypothetical protein CH063_09213, partial [Colletotrichum higginsianum]